MSLPNPMRALVIETVGQPLKLKTVPMPTAIPGSVVVKVISAVADHNLPKILSGRVYKFPTPFTPGGRSIGRVVATGQDTTYLKVGQLVMCDAFIRSRDNSDHQLVWGAFGGPSPETQKFMADNWAAGAYAEYMRAPLENCHALDEALLCDGFGYTLTELNYIPTALIPYGGLRSIDLQPGERVVVAPATGSVTGAAVHVALAMGAQVIAVGHNETVLRRLQEEFGADRVKLFTPTGDVDKDAEALQQWGPVDKFIDISPFAANNSTHVRSCLMALRPSGKAVLMGVLNKDIMIPYDQIVWKKQTIRGQYMYERDDAKSLIKLVETSALKLGKAGGQEVSGTFKLEEIDEAFFESLNKYTAAGQMLLITP